MSGTQQTFTNQVRYDALAPRVGTQPTFLINTVGGTSWLSKANKFSQTCSSTATVGVFNCSLSSVVTDLGVDVVMTCLAFFLAYVLRPRDATPNQVIPPFTYYLGMMVLSVFAVVTNMTLERSNGISR